MKNNKIYKITVEEKLENNTYKKLDQTSTNYAIIADGKNINIMAHEINVDELIELVLNIIDAAYMFMSKKVNLTHKEYVEVLKNILLENEEKEPSIEIDINGLINQMFNNDKD